MSLSDLEKIQDVLEASKKFFKRRDEMNAEVHLAREVRYSPLTVEVMAACDRVRTLLEDANSERVNDLKVVRDLVAKQESERKDNPDAPPPLRLTQETEE